jgi:hypothetical protein
MKRKRNSSIFWLRGINAFSEKVEKSQLDEDHPGFQPEGWLEEK